MGKGIVLLWLLTSSVVAQAADMAVIPQSCADNNGRSIASRADDSAARIIETRIENGKPVMVYNAKLLPHLLPETRTFFYAHECVRNNMAMPVDQDLSLEQARRADCAAVAAMQRSKLIGGAAAIAAIEMDADLSSEAWSGLPGPARKLALGSCAKQTGSLALPAMASSEKWNRCVHACGEALRNCGTGALCQQNYGKCSAGCESKR